MGDYALLMRPGQPIYEDFTRMHVADVALPAAASQPVLLALNATAVLTRRAFSLNRNS